MLSIYLFLQEKKYQVNKEESYPNLMGRQYFEEKKKAKNLHANIRNLYLLFRQTASQLYIQGLKYVKGTALSHTSDFIIKRKQEMNTKWDFRPSDRATHIPCNMPPGKRFTSGTAQWGKHSLTSLITRQSSILLTYKHIVLLPPHADSCQHT